MDKQHAEDFKRLLQGTLAGYESEKVALQRDVLAWWWKALEPYSFQNVSAAMAIHSRQSRFKPKPADLIEIINAQDGRPSADEAWPMALLARSEASTVVWTEETEKAWHQCYPAFEVGDEFGARMAFRFHYQRLIDHSRMQGQPVKWSVSLGHDPEHRATALEVAKHKGLLTHERIEKLNPAGLIEGDGQHIAALVGYDGKKDAPPSPDIQANLKKLREVLATPAQGKAEISAQQKAEEEKRRQELIEQENELLAQAANRYQEKSA